MTKTILRVVGARPQFMQVPSVMDALAAHGMRQILIHTGQHYDATLSDVFFKDLGLPPPDVNLHIGSHGHGAGTGRMLEGLERVMLETRPDGVVVDGDTNSTLAGALAAVKLHIPLFHIEAGVRDFDRRRPEEINRIATDHIATLNFAPIQRAMDNLVTEGLGSRSQLTGDVLLDCLMRNLPRARTTIRERLGLAAGAYNVLSLHRPENTDVSELARFREIMTALRDIDQPIIWPMHPRTQRIVDHYAAAGGALGPIRVIEPLGYLDMVGLVRDSEAVFTDSGGLPREAAWMGRRVVMLSRIDTWPDMLERGWATIGKTDAHSIRVAFDRAEYAPPEVRAFYGGGQAGERIATLIATHLGTRADLI